jgi:hypothetical protein
MVSDDLAPENKIAPETVPQGIVLTAQQQKSRRLRNVAIGLAVGFFVLLFYAVTIAKLGFGLMNHPA